MGANFLLCYVPNHFMLKAFLNYPWMFSPLF